LSRARLLFALARSLCAHNGDVAFGARQVVTIPLPLGSAICVKTADCGPYVARWLLEDTSRGGSRACGVGGRRHSLRAVRARSSLQAGQDVSAFTSSRKNAPFDLMLSPRPACFGLSALQERPRKSVGRARVQYWTRARRRRTARPRAPWVFSVAPEEAIGAMQRHTAHVRLTRAAGSHANPVLSERLSYSSR